MFPKLELQVQALMWWAEMQEANPAERNKDGGSSLGMGSLEDPLIQNVGVARDHSVSTALASRPPSVMIKGLVLLYSHPAVGSPGC